MISFYIVSRGNWLIKVANIKKKKKKTMVLQFMLEAPRRCTILCFLFANCDGIK